MQFVVGKGGDFQNLFYGSKTFDMTLKGWWRCLKANLQTCAPKKENKNKDIVVVPLNYNHAMPKVLRVLNKHNRAMIQKNKELKETFPS
jgi:hypothetical protein